MGKAIFIAALILGSTALPTASHTIEPRGVEERWNNTDSSSKLAPRNTSPPLTTGSPVVKRDDSKDKDLVFNARATDGPTIPACMDDNTCKKSDERAEEEEAEKRCGQCGGKG